MVAVLVSVVRLRGLRFVAAVLISAGVYLIATGGDQNIARGMLVAGILYAIVALRIK